MAHPRARAHLLLHQAIQHLEGWGCPHSAHAVKVLQLALAHQEEDLLASVLEAWVQDRYQGVDATFQVDVATGQAQFATPLIRVPEGSVEDFAATLTQLGYPGPETPDV
jgi:hypothetical protein